MVVGVRKLMVLSEMLYKAKARAGLGDGGGDLSQSGNMIELVW